MSIAKTKDTRRVTENVRHLGGTLIADLNLLKAQALTANRAPKGHGFLNNTSFPVGIIGCETIGRYVYGAYLDLPKDNGYLSKGVTTLRNLSLP